MVKPSKKSKAWVADPANRVCDAEGSWYCTGQYPPPLKPLIDKRKNFAQLEDFNKKKTKEDEEYTKEYMKRMEGGGAAPPEEAEAAAAAQELNLKYASLRGGHRQPTERRRCRRRYIGCYASEDQLGSDKEYGGGVHGANMALAVQFARDQRKVTPSSWRGQVCPSLSHIARNLCSAISPSLAWASTAITLPSQKRRAATQCRTARATLRVRTAARTSAAARMPHAAGQRRHPGRSWCDDGWCTSCRCVPASSLGALSGSAHT